MARQSKIARTAVWLFVAGCCIALVAAIFTLRPPEEVPDPDPPYMATWEVDIVASSDDCKENIAGTVTLDGFLVMNGIVLPSGLKYFGLRFIGSPIPQGSTIDFAQLQIALRLLDCGGVGECPFFINGIDEDNPATFSSSNKCSGRPTTTATVVDDTTFIGTLGTTACNVEPRFFDLTAIVQEIIDRPGYADGNAIAFVFTRDIWIDQMDDATVHDFDNSCPAHLIVEYTPPPPPPGDGSSRALTQNSESDPLSEYDLH